MLDYSITVEAPLTDTLVSGQLYLRPPSQNPVLLNSDTKSVFSRSRKGPAPVIASDGAFFQAPRVSAYESFDCTAMLLYKIQCLAENIVISGKMLRSYPLDS